MRVAGLLYEYRSSYAYMQVILPVGVRLLVKVCLTMAYDERVSRVSTGRTRHAPWAPAMEAAPSPEWTAAHRQRSQV